MLSRVQWPSFHRQDLPVQVRQHLQHHVPVELRVAGAVDLAHAALADEGGHVVVPEAGTDG